MAKNSSMEVILNQDYLIPLNRIPLRQTLVSKKGKFLFYYLFKKATRKKNFRIKFKFFQEMTLSEESFALALIEGEVTENSIEKVLNIFKLQQNKELKRLLYIYQKHLKLKIQRSSLNRQSILRIRRKCLIS
jgi:hypothetical protein